MDQQTLSRSGKMEKKEEVEEEEGEEEKEKNYD